MKRATALTLVITTASFHGVTAARAAEAAEQPEAATLEVGGGPRQRWDCVVFVADGDIYVVNLDGTGLTRLTDDDADFSPAFSPDGTKIAYVSEAEEHYGVYVVNADGSDPRRLSPANEVMEEESIHGDFQPVFAPDGERVAAVRSYESYKREYEIIFLPTSGGPEENFSTKIEDAWERERRNNYGSALPPRNIRFPVFSGDGRKIVFRDYPGINGSRVWIANADGSAARRLTEGNAFFLVFSPDGQTVAFYEWVNKSTHIFVVNADGTAKRQITSGDSYNFCPAFSPDGKKIIYESSVRGEEKRVASDIYIMNADGSEPRALTRTPVDERLPRFTPDGSKIVFYASPFEIFPEAEIYVMNADGSGRRFLAAGDDFSLGPSLVEGRLLDSYGNWHDVVDGPEATPPGE